MRKRTSHVTVIVARMDEDQLKVVRSKRDAEEANRRARRVARTRGSAAAKKVAEEASVDVADMVSASPEPIIEVEETEVPETEAAVAEEDAVEAVDEEAGVMEEAFGVTDEAVSGGSTESEEEEK